MLLSYSRFCRARCGAGIAGIVGIVGVLVAALGLPGVVLAQVGQSQELGVVLEGVITEAVYKDQKAAGSLEKVNKGTGFVFVTVTPSSAEVTVAKRRGTGGSFTLENIPSGYQPVQVRAQGYDTIDGYVLVEPMRVSKVSIVLPPKDGDLTILSEPAGARVLIDGQSVGVAPMTVERLAGGQHDVMLTADGGLVWQGKVLISGGVEVLRPTLRPSENNAALATTAPVLPSSPRPVAPAALPPTPSVSPMPVTPVPQRGVVTPTAPVTPAAPQPGPQAAAQPEPSDIDLTGLSPQLRAMAWERLAGKSVEIVLGTGQRASVKVEGVRGSNVVLAEPNGASRLVPMSHISKVRE